MKFQDFVYRFSGKGMMKTQLWYIKNFEKKSPLNYVGRFENLHEDYKYINSEINLKNQELPHELKGCGEDYRKAYNNDTIDFIENIYKEEIDYFGYSFEF